MLYDPRLFLCDILNPFAENLKMILGHIGDDGDEGVNDIGGVQSPSQPYFQYGHVNLLVREIIQCESCGEEIGVGRLRARPVASLCVDCKDEQERLERRGE